MLLLKLPAKFHFPWTLCKAGFIFLSYSLSSISLLLSIAASVADQIRDQTNKKWKTSDKYRQAAVLRSLLRVKLRNGYRCLSIG